MAIASLGGPWAAAGMGAREAVKHLKKAHDSQHADPGAAAVGKVFAAIRDAASAEVAVAEVDRGLELARDVIAVAGMTQQRMAELWYDPKLIATQVIAAGRAWEHNTDEEIPHVTAVWGSEVHYGIAERAIRHV